MSKVGIACRAGLRCGDFISRVNDVNVSRASWETVTKMIKQSKTRSRRRYAPHRPISSPSSSDAKLVDLEKLVVADPFIRQPILQPAADRFQRAVYSCQSLRPRFDMAEQHNNYNYHHELAAQQQQQPMQKYPSMRELAYRKLREQANIMRENNNPHEKIKSKA